MDNEDLKWLGGLILGVAYILAFAGVYALASRVISPEFMTVLGSGLLFMAALFGGAGAWLKYEVKKKDDRTMIVRGNRGFEKPW